MAVVLSRRFRARFSSRLLRLRNSDTGYQRGEKK